ncbi:hypothetical protein [Phyllobacterium phragmitis]|uniref:Uncharacterized protein n=1 Tax=Phyllobacterium phragmitis TaxID=2670329 RepID=A0ABQ0GYI8_9HYPH
MVKLADDTIISIGDTDIVLRPCLRFAMRLDRRPGSFAQLGKEIMDGSLTAACEIIRDHADIPMLETRILDNGIDRLKWPLIAYLGQCMGLDPSDTSEPANDNSKATNGKPQTTHDFLIGLYRIGTGWLGWSPEATLDASPAEIMEAQRGRMDMLKAIFGDGKAEKKDTMGGFTDANVFAAFRGLGTTVVKGGT